MKLNQHTSDAIVVTPLPDGMFQLSLQNNTDHSLVFNLDLFYHCLSKQREVLARSDCQGICFRLSGAFRAEDYRQRVQEATDASRIPLRSELMALTRELFLSSKVRILQFDQLLTGEALSFALQFDRRIAIGKGAGLSFADCAYGILPGWGALPRVLQRGKAIYYIPAFVNGVTLRNSALSDSGLGDGYYDTWEEARTHEEHMALPQQWTIGEQGQQGVQFISGRTQGRSLYEQVLQSAFQDLNNATVSGLLIREHFAYLRLLKSAETKRRLRVSYYGIREVRRKSEAHKTDFSPRRLGVIGAGMMGAGIAYQAAKSDIQVTLQDVTLEQAQRGKNYAEKVIARLLRNGEIQTESAEQLLQRIHPTDSLTDLMDSDVIIEAVFEDFALKSELVAESLPLLSSGGILASNTTSLPIGNLSVNLDQAHRFIGLHFFSPVDRMALVEVVRGEQTSEETLGRALAFVDRLGKIPIIVNDGPGFYTSRIFFHYLLEGGSMLLQGVPIQRVEESAKEAGMAVGPLAVLDEISLPLMLKVYDQYPSLTNSQQRVYHYLRQLVEQGRTGRRAKRGFYSYEPGQTKHFWTDPELPVVDEEFDKEELGFRLLAVMALDAARCLEDGILERPIDGDVGAVFGLGYPSYTGGVFGLMDSVGVDRFISVCESYRNYGEQWVVPELLKRMARGKERFDEGLDALS